MPTCALFLTTFVTFLPTFYSYYLLGQLIFPSLGSAATASFQEGRATESVGMASWDDGLRADGASGSVAPALPTHAPTSAAAPMDFVQELLRQSAPMGDTGR
jgi:hypothetical protein